jgi:hypothetical protein
MADLTFTPVGSTNAFLMSRKFGSFIVGPYGSTKTTTGLMKIPYEAAQMAACQDGIRRSRCVVVRNTRQMLSDTTIPDFLKWFPDGEAGTFLKSDGKFVLRFDDVECEVLFRGLDDPNDVRRLLSLQLSFGVMDEFREIHPDIYEALAGRTGRYPDKVLVPPRPEWGVDDKGNPIGGCVRDDGSAAKRIWGMTNPPDMDTFWEQLLTDPPRNVHVTLQPSGVSDEADWIHLLDSGYYEDLMELHAADQAWVDIYVKAKFGRSLAGRPVFSGFDRDFHVAKETLTPLVSDLHPLIVGLDFGLCYSDDTEVLTLEGWKLFKDVDADLDVVATLNPEGFALEYAAINFKVEEDFDGELIEWDSQNVSFCVTPEHRTPYTRRDTPETLRWGSAEELEGSMAAHRYVQLTANDWEGEGVSDIPHSALSEATWATLLGWFMSDGNVEKGTNRVSITQLKPAPGLRALTTELEAAGLNIRAHVEGLRFSDVGIAEYLRALGGKHAGERWVPRSIMFASRETIGQFIDAYTAGDGHARCDGGEHTIWFNNEGIAGQFQELALKMGWTSSVNWQKGGTSYIEGRAITCDGGWNLRFKKSLKRAELLPEGHRRVPYRGKIYCLNVPHHTLYVRRNGRPCWNGNTPACTISQAGPDGKFYTFAELVSEGMGIQRFSREMLKPLLAQRFPGHPVIIVGDPAGTQRAQTDERTVYDVLESEGFNAIPAKTNSIVARIGAVETLLAGQINGGPRHVIDPCCRKLIAGMQGGYRYRMKKSGEVEDKPDKNFYSHVCDGHQYGCLHVDNVVGGKRPRRGGERRDVVKLNNAGWV